MMPTRKIACDGDGVVFDFQPALNDYYNERFGTNFKLKDYTHYDLERTWGGTKQNATEIVLDFYRTPEFRNVLPLKGAPEAVRKLASSNELILLTSRPDFIGQETRVSLEKHFGNAFTKIHHNGQYGIHSSGLDKSGYCLKNGILIILEDNLDIAIKCAAKGMLAFLFNQPWNQQEKLPERVIRVGINKNHWEEVLECIG